MIVTCVRRRHWYDEIDEGVYVGCVPVRRFMNTFQKMSVLGVGGVVNLCDEHPGNVRELLK